MTAQQLEVLRAMGADFGQCPVCLRQACEGPRAHLAAGAVYVIQAGGPTGNIKIGWSCDVWERLRHLQSSTACSDTLALLGCQPAHRFYEGHLHWLARDEHVRGEWFRFDGRALSVARSIVAFAEKFDLPREAWSRA